jgi:hypothetical protein
VIRRGKGLKQREVPLVLEAREPLQDYLEPSAIWPATTRVCFLVHLKTYQLRDLVVAHGQEGTDAARFAAMDALITGRGGDLLIEECDAHLAHAGSNYYPSTYVG